MPLPNGGWSIHAVNMTVTITLKIGSTPAGGGEQVAALAAFGATRRARTVRTSCTGVGAPVSEFVLRNDPWVGRSYQCAL